MQKKEIYKYIDRNIDAHVKNIQDWVKQQSVSWDNLGMGDAWKIVYESYKKLGCQTVEIIPGKYYPGIFAYYDAGSKYTTVILWQKDGQPKKIPRHRFK